MDSENGRRVSFVIVHWGDAALTQSAVRGVRDSSACRAEQIVVVENGSPSHISAADARVLTLPENRGYAAAVNVGLRQAFGCGAEQVVVMNNDLRFVPGALAAMLSAVSAPWSRVGCVGATLDDGSHGIVQSGGVVSWVRGRARLLSVPEHRRSLDFITGACFLLHRAAFEDVGGFPEHYFLYWEDVAYGFRLRERGWRLATAVTPPLRHRHSASLGQTAQKTYYLVRNGALFVREYAPAGARQWLTSLEPLRIAWARAHGRWEIVRALRDASAGVTGPLAADVDLSLPPA